MWLSSADGDTGCRCPGSDGDEGLAPTQDTSTGQAAGSRSPPAAEGHARRWRCPEGLVTGASLMFGKRAPCPLGSVGKAAHAVVRGTEKAPAAPGRCRPALALCPADSLQVPGGCQRTKQIREGGGAESTQSHCSLSAHGRRDGQEPVRGFRPAGQVCVGRARKPGSGEHTQCAPGTSAARWSPAQWLLDLISVPFPEAWRSPREREARCPVWRHPQVCFPADGDPEPSPRS